MSSILRFKYPALLLACGVFVILEIIARILPLEYASGTGIYMTENRKALVEASTPEFDYIILGDSRSLSVKGHEATAAEPYSIYNLSLPAMGPRYFQFYLEKYLENRKKKPAAVIFAGDPGLFQRSWNTPSHDSKMLYSDAVDESLWNYLSLRFTRRIEYFKQGQRTAPRDDFGALLWDAFSHRYLHMFGPIDMMRQYTGAERVFMLREAIPNQFHLYRFRDGIKQYVFEIRANSFRAHPVPAECSKCSFVPQAICHPDYSRIEQNVLLRDRLKAQNGGINLGDLIEPGDRMKYYMMRDSAIKKQAQAFEKELPDLAPLEALIKTATSRGIKIVLMDVPAIEPLRHATYYRLYFEQLREIVKKYPLARIVRFPDPNYPVQLFVEQVHYECEGAERLNREFYASVFPEIKSFAPPGGE